MTHTRLLVDTKEFNEDFKRCCEEYDSIDLAAAWCGDPKHALPYKQLERLGLAVRATIGVSFEQTHPEGIRWLMGIASDVRIFRSETAILFHPKIYLFRRERSFALFLGSSNLTYSGFYRNIEANVLIEGDVDNEDVRLVDLMRMLDVWRSDVNSFAPTKKWLDGYAAKFLASIDKARKNGIETPATDEDQIPTTNWLSQADWDVYFAQIHNGLRGTGRAASTYLDLLESVQETLPLPWDASIFHEINNRRIIGGMEPFGWLGHVASSGAFRKIMADTTDTATQSIIADAINQISDLQLPLNWNALELQLNRLTALGPTMKVWSRLLCLVRPDVYCTVASPIVRVNMSETLSVAKASFEKPAGYIRILKMVHGAPWFLSSRPSDLEQALIWDRRVAMMDAIFYE